MKLPSLPAAPAVVFASLFAAIHLITSAPALADTQAVPSGSPNMSTISTEARQETDAAEADKTAPSEKELLEQTRRNTRLASRLSPQFATARRLADLGDFDGALSTYDSLISEAPTFAPAYSNRANILVSRNRLALAIADYDIALQLAPLDGDAWVIYVNRAVALLAQSGKTNARAALDDLNVAYSRKGNDPLVLQNRASAYEALGKWDSAIRDYQAALSYSGNDVKPFWLRYALVLFQKGKESESIAMLKRVGGIYGVDDVKAALAVVYFEDGDLGKAETYWSDMQRPKLFESRQFLEDRKWPPRAIEGMDHFRSLKE